VKRRPPIVSRKQRLPFHDPAFSWDTFEDFFCAFLNEGLVIFETVNGKSEPRRVISARPFGRKGDKQFGIDVVAEMDHGETWEFQCKHYKSWSPSQTAKALSAYKRQATRRFLVVTREVSEACRDVVRKHPAWEIWDSRDIDKRFLDLGATIGSRLLLTHFGPGWSELFFNIPGDSPLISAEAKFARQLRPNLRFHHRHTLIGRTKFLESMDAFVRDAAKRVFVLRGKGGLGKSKLLQHWSRQFTRRHRGQTLRFISDQRSSIAVALQNHSGPLTLVFDDAHRLDDVRRQLFPILPNLEKIKLVLALRPGPIEEIRHELLSVGFDSTEIVFEDELRPLNSDQCLQLVDLALKPEFGMYRAFLQHASRDCTLIAIVGAELINSGTLAGATLSDEKEFQNRVFFSLLEDADPVRQQFGAQQTDDFLRLLSLLGPMKFDAQTLGDVGTFIGLNHSDQVSHLRDALDGVGLLYQSGAGLRVTPDLLSDHLAYTACYDPSGGTRTFAERVLEHFSPDKFPKMIQHLAEAEWRAMKQSANSASVVEPLWQWFCGRFSKSSFRQRNEQIREWSNIAQLQPERSLQLADLAISLTTSPVTELYSVWNQHEESLGWLPRMVASVASWHPSQVPRCLELLWHLGKDKAASVGDGHPITLMGEIASFENWKSLDVLHAALTWFEKFFGGDRCRETIHQPRWLFEQILHPMLATSIEERLSTVTGLQIRQHLIHIENTRPVRERVAGICRTIIRRKDAALASAIIPTLERGCDIARSGFGGPVPLNFAESWNEERRKFLEIFVEMIGAFDEPLLLFQIRHALFSDLRYGHDSEKYQSACRRVFRAIPSSLDLGIARLTLSSDFEEFDRKANSENWQELAARQWQKLLHGVALDLLATHPTPANWLSHLVQLHDRWRKFFVQPNFAELLQEIARTDRSSALAAAQLMLDENSHPLASNFGDLVLTATSSDHPARLRMLNSAFQNSNDLLKASAVATCTRWRQAGDFPEEAAQCLRALAPSAVSVVAFEIVFFVYRNTETATMDDWHLLMAIPFGPDDVNLAGRVASASVSLLERDVHPPAAEVERFLRRFEALSKPGGSPMETAFEKLSAKFPVSMFQMLWRRCQSRKTDPSLKHMFLDFEDVRFPLIFESDDMADFVQSIEELVMDGEYEFDFDEVQLLQRVLEERTEPCREWLRSMASHATNEKQLEKIRELASVGKLENAVIYDPLLARILLERSATVDGDCHDRMFARLVFLGGGRGASSGEPDKEWTKMMMDIETLAHPFSGDPELAPLFAKLISEERSQMQFLLNRMPSLGNDD
jgi:hypothetical protein